MAGSLAIFGVALAPTAGATTSVTTSRLAGTTRYGTAKAVATDASLAGGTVAIVASGEDAHLADALSSSGLAGVSAPAPIVLTQTDTYTQDAKDALAALKAKGVTTVKVVGGTAAVSDAVLNAIKADGFTTTRVADVDRFGTAASVGTAMKAIKAIGTTGGLATAIIANGFTYVDALSAGAMAYSQNFPILLVNADSVPANTSAAISSLGIKKAIIVGGTAAISSAVQSSIESATGNPALRIGGTDRNDTAGQIGDYEINTLGFTATSAVLANGISLVDALSDGPYAGQNKAPIALTNGTGTIPTATAAWLDKYSSRISKLIVSGGTAAISDAEVTSAQTSAQNTSNDTTFTSAPELQSVGFAATQSTGGTADKGFTTLRYTFSKPIVSTPITASSFKLWSPFGESVTGDSAQLDSTNSSAVLVVFQNATKGIVLADSTVATVAAAAVQDSSGKNNPEGEVNGFIPTQNFAAGITRNPDLVSVTAVSGTAVSETQYRFVFDSAPSAVANQNGFIIVDTDGNRRVSTAAVIDSADATGKTVLVTYATGPNAGYTAGRGVALSGAVTTAAAGMSNPQEKASVAGATNTPDLVSVTLDKTNNRATFTFDENVETLGLTGTGGNGTTTFNPSGDATKFHLYYRGVTTFTGIAGNAMQAINGLNADRSTTDLRSVVVQFPAGTVNDAVMGAYIDAGAATRDTATDTTTTGFIGAREDAIGIAESFAAGGYLGPQLVSVTKDAVSDGFTTTGYNTRFTFDKTAVTLNSATSFFAVDANGTRVALSGCVLGTSVGFTNRVTCTVNSTSNAEALVVANIRLGTVAADAVRLNPAIATGPNVGSAGTTMNIGNHEERASAS